MENTRIAIIGLGYVGLPLAVEFAKKYEVIFPWPMAWLTKFLRLMPYPVFFWIVKTGIMSKTK